jgi:hypothetical protein
MVIPLVVANNPSYLGGRRIKSSRPAQSKLVKPYLENKDKRARGGVAQIIEHLLSKPEAH